MFISGRSRVSEALSLTNRRLRPRSTRRQAPSRPGLEQLEDRCLLAAWNFESVESLTLSSCLGAYVTGFDYDPANRPVVGWNVDSGCSSEPGFAYWTRKDAGVWSPTVLDSPLFPGGARSSYGHRYALRDDGTPFVVYAAIVGEHFYT